MCFRWGRSLPPTHPHQRQEGARAALVTLSLVNLMNYCDRYVPNAVKELLKDELHLTDFETSLPTAAMLIVYMVFAIIFGQLADKQVIDRRALLTAAIIFWSLATGLAGLSQDLGQLVFFRSLVGVGEAAYTTIVPAMIADFYPPRDRNKAYLVFYMAAPVGGALGFMAGAGVGAAFGWRWAFVVCGVPGILLASLIPTLNDPVRGINDQQKDDSDTEASSLTSSGNRASFFTDAMEIFSNMHWMLGTLGLAANSFAIGGFAEWYATLVVRVGGGDLGITGLVLGAASVVGGIGGSILGAKTAELWEAHVKSAYFMIPAAFTVPGALLAAAAVNFVQNLAIAYTLVVPAQLFFFTQTAPVSTATINVIPVHLRARSSGIQIFAVHVLGDIISPPVIGVISDATGSLLLGMQLAWMFILVAGFYWWLAATILDPLPVLGTSGKAADDEELGNLRSFLLGDSEEADTGFRDL